MRSDNHTGYDSYDDCSEDDKPGLTIPSFIRRTSNRIVQQYDVMLVMGEVPVPKSYVIIFKTIDYVL